MEKPPKKKPRNRSVRALPATLIERHIDALDRNTVALEHHAALLHSSGLQACVLGRLNMADAPAKVLDTPFNKLFNGIAKPIDTIIAACENYCYKLTPADVWKRVDAHGGEAKVTTLRSFLQCVGS